jgi:hypothetical protein
MSGVLIAVLALTAPPSEGTTTQALPPTRATLERKRIPLRSGPELRDAVRAALRRWARPTDTQADQAARELLRLHQELRADARLSRSQRAYFLGKVRIRLDQLSDQISKRIARAKRLAENRKPKSVGLPEGKAGPLAQRQFGGPAGGFMPGGGMGGRPFGGGAGMQVPDHGQELVELIQTVIRPETWDVNGGPGTIYYWYPGRALVIRQMGEVHEEIGGALDQLRRAGP